jgi:hypothetical protein
MGPHDGAVDNEILHIWIMDEMLMHPYPDSFVAPTCEALIDAVPGTVMLRQQSPLAPLRAIQSTASMKRWQLVSWPT